MSDNKNTIADLTPQQKAALLMKRRKQQAALNGLQGGNLDIDAISNVIYTNHFISQPVNFTASPEEVKDVLARMKNAGITWGFNFQLEGVPYLSYTSRIDKTINMEDFKNKISFGNNVQLNSSFNYPFHTGPMRITIVKKGENQVGSLHVGNNVYMPGTAIVSYDNVTIENNVIIASMVTIMDCNGHTLTDRNTPGELEKLTTGPVRIKDGAWIGYGSTILKGVTIGKNSVVGAHSVVHKPVPDNTVVAGNPAKVIRTL